MRVGRWLPGTPLLFLGAALFPGFALGQVTTADGRVLHAGDRVHYAGDKGSPGIYRVEFLEEGTGKVKLLGLPEPVPLLKISPSVAQLNGIRVGEKVSVNGFEVEVGDIFADGTFRYYQLGDRWGDLSRARKVGALLDREAPLPGGLTLKVGDRVHYVDFNGNPGVHLVEALDAKERQVRLSGGLTVPLIKVSPEVREVSGIRVGEKALVNGFEVEVKELFQDGTFRYYQLGDRWGDLSRARKVGALLDRELKLPSGLTLKVGDRVHYVDFNGNPGVHLVEALDAKERQVRLSGGLTVPLIKVSPEVPEADGIRVGQKVLRNGSPVEVKRIFEDGTIEYYDVGTRWAHSSEVKISDPGCQRDFVGVGKSAAAGN